MKTKGSILRSCSFVVGACLVIYALVKIVLTAIPLMAGMRQYASSISPIINKTYAERWAEVNPDIVGWLTVEGTGIDFPVMQDTPLREDFLAHGTYTFDIPEDRDEYIKRLYKYLYYDYRGEPSSIGSIMVDAVYDINASYAVIYGHNAHAPGVLFSDLKNFEEREFFEEHKTAVLCTKAGREDLALLMVSKISSYSEEVYGRTGLLDGSFDTEKMLTYMDANKLFGLRAESERYIVLSTCYDEPDSPYRLVLLYSAERSASQAAGVRIIS